MRYRNGAVVLSEVDLMTPRGGFLRHQRAYNNQCSSDYDGPNGFVHGLKMHFGPEAYRLMFNAGINLATATDASIQAYADHRYQYDTSRRVTLEVSAVCPSCPGGGTTSDTFAYLASTNTPALNHWAMRTTQSLPDGSKIIVYTNYIGLTILYVNVDPSGNMWAIFYRYDPTSTTPQVIWKAMPSAVALPASLATLEAYADLLNQRGPNSAPNYQYLQPSSGLIETTAYGPVTGVPSGYVASRSVRQGQTGSDVMVHSTTYTSNTDSAGNIVYVPATQSDYPAGAAVTTSLAYTWYAGTNLIQQKTTTLPAVTSGQNGSGAADTIVEQYDAFGNRTEITDERGIVDTFAFDVSLGRITEQVLNYQSGVTQPGVNVTTDFTWDNQGRLTLTLGPSHTVVIGGTATTIRPVTNQLYIQSIQPTPGTTWDVDQTWTGKGYATGSGPYTYTLLNPISISKMDKDGRSTDQITSKRSTGSGLLAATDTFVQTDWQTWSTTQYSAKTDTTVTPPTVAHQMVSGRSYFLIPSSGIGTVGTNFAETDFGYDALERRNRVAAPGGTIERKVWSTPQRVASVWVGTNDTGATDSDPTGGGATGNNMVQITANQYDGGSAGGDGNLTQITKYVSATTGDTRVTAQGFDFRNRRTSITDALGGYTALTLDNLDQTTLTQQYASLGGYLIAQSGTNFDNRGQIYQQLVYAVDPASGTVGNALTTNIWRDAGGNIVQRINAGDGKVFNKSTINGVGWITNTYRGYNTSGTSYAQALTVANDTIIEESDFTFDETGNVISAASMQRLNDATGTGALSAGTQPKARVSYIAGWFDGLDRAIATANYGAASSFTRPATPPTSSATVVVNLTAYDDAGREYQTTDAMSIVNQTGYDNASRKTQTIEAYGSSTPRTTNYAYTLDDLVATMTAVNSTTGDQTTTWTYGTTLATSGVARNDLLVSVTYPDSVSGSDAVGYTYNRLSERFTITDQRGTVRMLYRDKLGRQTHDSVPTVGTSTDTAVLRISTTYEIRGMVKTITSYNNATPGSGTALNQVQLDYNTFAQLITEWQEHSGTVTGSTPNVQYGFDTGASNSNEIRLNALTYPNARVITPDYGTTGGMNDLLNRVAGLKDGTTTLAAYIFIGLGTVIRRDSPEPQVRLDLWGGTSGVFNGFDIFSRIIDQRWLNYSTSTDLDRYQYGYDKNSNRIWKANLLTTGLDEFYTYDPLSRLTEMQRGVLNSTKTGITGTPARQMSYGLDITGNWGSYLTKTAGTTDLSQTRGSNKVNEITVISGTPAWTTPAYDPAGNMTTMPQPASPANPFTAVYDAWNRMVKIGAPGGTVATYAFDGRNRRIVKVTTSLGETRHFYFTNNWQDIEERTGSPAIVERQYVWGVRYIDELVCRDATPGGSSGSSSSSSSSSGSGALQRLYAMQDGNFNLTAICATSGSVVERYLFDPYANRTIMNASWGAITSSLYGWSVGHQGLLHDVESGLLYNRSRLLHPALGRWMQRDPVGYADHGSLYEYHGSNPNNRLDPSGMTWKGAICRAACWGALSALGAAGCIACAAGEVISVGTLLIPCGYVQIAIVGGAAAIASLCAELCPPRDNNW